MLTVSLIIPTRDRPNELGNLLRSISVAGDDYSELLVIDSSSNSKDIEMNKKNTMKIGGRHILFNEKGLSKARNKGIKESQSDIVVFADDDFVVKTGWIDNLLSDFNDGKSSCVTGRMISRRKDRASDLYEKAMSFDRGPKRRVFSRNDLRLTHLLATITYIGQKRLLDRTPVPWAIGYGFCAFRRRVFEDVGLFDELLGRGTKATGADDIDLYYRLLKKGHRIIYEPRAIVLHDHRKDLSQIHGDALNSGKSVRSFILKYLPKDLYVWLVFVGYFFLLFFSSIKSELTNGVDLNKMIRMESKGLLLG